MSIPKIKIFSTDRETAKGSFAFTSKEKTEKPDSSSRVWSICHQHIEFYCPSKITKKAATPKGNCFFGDLERTRTVDLQRDRLAC